MNHGCRELWLELQAFQENIVWMVEDVGETIDGMKVVEALIDGRKVYSVPKHE